MTSNQESGAAQANRVAKDFGIDPELIRQTMQQVQTGKLSPSEATSLLLAGNKGHAQASQTAQPLNAESLASLLDRLNKPPTDIVDRWCEQMRLAALVHYSETGQPLPSIELNQWSLSASGDLLWRERSYARDLTGSAAPNVDSESAQTIEQFRQSLLGSTSVDSQPATNFASTTKADENRTSRPASRRTHNFGLRRIVLGALIGICALAIVGIVYQASVKDDTKSISDANPNAFDPSFDASANNSASPKSIKIDRARVDDLDDDVQLETLDQVTNNVGADQHADSTAINKQDLLSLDSFMPVAPGFRGEGSDTSDISNPPASSPASAASAAADPDAMTEDNQEPPAEAPQQTRASVTKSARLPAVSQTDQSVKISETEISTCQLSFPFDIGLELREQGTSHEIIDAAKQSVIATISNKLGAGHFAWTTNASKSSAAMSLVHGRLQLGDGNMVFLRPTIESDLWMLDLERHDLRPTWDLTVPIPPRVTRLSADFQLPDKVEVGWIEPIDPTSPRRARGVAVLTSTENETVTLGVRLDIRCSRKLSCRVRYAARMGTDAPWQVVSRPLLEQTADELTKKSEFISKQIMQMSAMYSAADTDQRRILRPRRDALEEQSNSIQQFADSVAALRSLVAQVEGIAALKLRLWVEWPDSQQTILETVPPNH